MVKVSNKDYMLYLEEMKEEMLNQLKKDFPDVYDKIEREVLTK